jgi:copper oxidase (laccase) domain-containing protein
LKAIASHQLGPHLFQTYSEKPEDIEILFVEQVHGANISAWNAPQLNDSKSDGIYFMFDKVEFVQDELIHLGIKTADCLSVAIIGNTGAINLHAGWRGLAEEILFNPIVEKCEPHTFLLSPAIAGENYQVGAEFKDVFSKFPEGLFEDKSNKKLTFSLHTTAQQMIKSRYPQAKIISNDLDTFSHPSLNSFRKDKTNKRNWNVLSLNLAQYRIS